MARDGTSHASVSRGAAARIVARSCSASVEARLRGRAAARGRAAGRARRRDDRRRRQAAAAAARRPRGAATRGRRARSGLVRAAVAVELVHSGDARPRRRARRRAPAPRPPDGRSPTAGREVATADRRPALRARVRRARAPTARRRRSRCSRTRARRSPRASCCSARTRGTPQVPVERYLRRCELKTARLFEAACELGALDGRRRRRGARRVRPAHRPGLPDPRRRARRLGPGRAHRQAARHRPARRHRHAAVHPRARARRRAAPRSIRARSTAAEEAEEVCDRDRRDGRAGRGAGARWRWSPRPRPGCRTACRRRSAARWSSWPTASSSATPACGQPPAGSGARRRDAAPSAPATL